MNRKTIERFSFLIPVLLSIPVILPYLHAGFFPTHDGEWAVVRLADMFRTLRDFAFPVRYSGALNFGYGYPLFNFAYPFPYYLGLLFVLLKFGFVGSIKMLFLLSVPFSALSMFYLSKNIWKSSIAGIISAILYIYLPYRFVDLFVRGSLGESLSFVLFPLLFLMFYKIAKHNENPLIFVLGVISYAALIMTHNIMAVFFTVVLFGFLIALFVEDRKINIKKIALCLLTAYFLSAFFWVPALSEKHNIHLSITPIADRDLYFVRPVQLLFSPIGYGTPTEKDAFTYQIGVPQIFLFGSVIFYMGYSFLKKKQKTNISFPLVLSLIIICFTILMFRSSAIIWKLPILSEINYPWTLLSQIGFLISLISGYLLTQKKFHIIIIVIALSAIIFYLPLAKPKEYVDRGDMFYLTNEATTTSSNELMPIWVKKQPIQHFSSKAYSLIGSMTIHDLSYNSRKISMITQGNSQGTVRINTIYYPGWNIAVDNVMTKFNYNNSFGVMDIIVPKGQHTITAVFSETPLRFITDVVSGIAVLALVIYLLFEKKKILI